MKDIQKLRTWFRSAFTFFILASILGVIMRLAFVVDLPEWIDYRNVTHAHSHIAMMGWLYCALLALIVYFFNLNGKIYNFYFWGAIICSVGMLVSFLMEGYGLFSIIFTTLHLMLSYGFAISVFKDLRKNKSQSSELAILFLKTSLVFLICSTFGTWMLGIIMGTALKGSALYYGSIQFFLHFQFNGWFVFSVIALFLQVLKQQNIDVEVKRTKYLYFLLTISCILTYALAVTWSTPDEFIFWINSLGVIIQFIALLYFLGVIKKVSTSISSKFSTWTYSLLVIAFACFSMKILIQTAVAIPFIATMSYTIKNFVIGFIHLLMLGGMSTFIIALYHHLNPNISLNFKSGIYIFLAGFILSETILFLQGLLLWMRQGFIPGYYIFLFLVSLLMAIGILILGFSFRRRGKISH